jgi:hypothetical protein
VKCLKCGRTISKLTLTSQGLQQIGPVCAREIDIHVTKKRKITNVTALVIKKAQIVDELQGELFEGE